jgi:hypothetical protein
MVFSKKPVDEMIQLFFRLAGDVQALSWIANPRAFLAANDEAAGRWLATTFLERDIPQLGLRAPAEALGRFWIRRCLLPWKNCGWNYRMSPTAFREGMTQTRWPNRPGYHIGGYFPSPFPLPQFRMISGRKTDMGALAVCKRFCRNMVQGLGDKPPLSLRMAYRGPSPAPT